MSNPNYRAELQDLYTSIQLYTGLNPAAADVHPAELTRRLMDAMAASAAALAHPEPVAPTDEDLPMPAAIRDMPEQQQRWCALGWRAALARWSTPATQPVPVSERPWEREGWCDAEGQCWLRRKHEEDGVTWRLMAPASVFDDAMPTYYAEALPHHALPTPEANNA